MPMKSLIENSSSYSKIAGDLCFCSKNEATNFDADIAKNNIFLNLSRIRLNY